ncbi:ABC transporter ATP-binding protein [Lacticaseibacillus paracasei]|uniref:ABC transporter ATP-binding protein n=2 Tax=Lacticaseibacillus paracasei TaxID=1597 RepID=A0A806LDJ0_LACPA|nr:ABC transporter ATP-binding protein [Lacticaseibacillus paracasei]AHJ31939.1 ABC transporter ATP-binding protein [Lacticaseibacillus paracasei N1115]EPC54213.1 metal ion ABC transporter ATPase [Lacticaseibacillus paracasei subsp. paracasei Lpp7]
MEKINIEGLTKRYRGKAAPALDQVSLEIETGMYGLLGKNGAGKSTLMKILTTLEQPTAGTVEVCGVPIKAAKAIRQQIGYLPQRFGFYTNMRVVDAMTYLAVLANVPARDQSQRIQHLLEEVHLADKARTKIKALSGGMLQRLGIAQALVNRPKVLIVDEPTAGLDPEERIRFRNLLTDFANERIVLLSTHIVSDIEATTNTIGILDQGRLLFNGTTDQLLLAANGHVFEKEVPVAKLNEFKRYRRITEQVTDGTMVKLRFLAASQINTSAQVLPTLEEAYLYLQMKHEEAFL